MNSELERRREELRGRTCNNCNGLRFLHVGDMSFNRKRACPECNGTGLSPLGCAVEREQNEGVYGKIPNPQKKKEERR